jgi:hypothetical protein
LLSIGVGRRTERTTPSFVNELASEKQMSSSQRLRNMNPFFSTFRAFFAGVICTLILVAAAGIFGASQAKVSTNHGEPVIPPLGTHMEDLSVGGGLITQPLDGLNCSRCTILAETVTYSGGAFRCEQCKVTAVTGIEFRGAANNALRALKTLGLDADALVSPSAPKENSGQSIKFPFTSAERATWTSPDMSNR